MMTRYRLTVGSMAYCLRRGIVSPPLVHHNRRLLTTKPSPPSTSPSSAVDANNKPVTPPKSALKSSTASKSAVKSETVQKTNHEPKVTSTSDSSRGRKTYVRPRGRPRLWGREYKFMRRGPRLPRFRERALDPERTTLRWAEKELKRRGTPVIGSRRRRVALRTSPEVPFEHMPYQCFQAALDILRTDRAAKLAEVDRLQRSMEFHKRKLLECSASEASNSTTTAAAGNSQTQDQNSQAKPRPEYHETRLRKLRRRCDELIILADINDPLVKRRSEDGLGDMSKPIYQHLARKRWASYRQLILEQRRDQFYLAADVLPELPIDADIEIFFGGRRRAHGAKLPALMTEQPPELKVQVFDSGQRPVMIVIMDLDMPDQAANTFATRLLYLGVNIPLSPTRPVIPLHENPGTVVPWTPPYAHQGSPYHRIGIFVFTQQRVFEIMTVFKHLGIKIPYELLKHASTHKTTKQDQGGSAEDKTQSLDTAMQPIFDLPTLSKLAEPTTDAAGILHDPRLHFSLQNLAKKLDADFSSSSSSSFTTTTSITHPSESDGSLSTIRPLTCTLFRSEWDSTTRELMRRWGIPGADMIWKRRPDPRLSPPKKIRGWEAKRQGPKYRHLWHMTKNIRGWDPERRRSSSAPKAEFPL